MTVATDNDRLIGGRYALEKIIGEGATGEVWRARHTALQSLVAIKFLHGSAAFRESTRKRFLKEAQVAARLNTRHAVQVFDFGVTEQGRPYLIMELLDGETLARRLVRLRRLTPADTAHIIRLAARALERAHAMGIVHRDFKPENIFLIEGEEGAVDVKVVDFGVAKLVGDLEEDREDEEGPQSQPPLASLASFTKTGATVGTPSYMSPEQAFARPGIGPAADIWALGVVAYECLTGVRPFRAPTLQALFEKIAKRKYAPAHDLCPDVPVEFDEWFRTACEPDPCKRFADVGVAAAALLEALGIQPNARAQLEAELSGTVSQSFRLNLGPNQQVSLTPLHDSPPPASDFGTTTGTSSKPAPFSRTTSVAATPSPVGRVAIGSLVLAAAAVIAIAAWRLTGGQPDSPPALLPPAAASQPSIAAPDPAPSASAAASAVGPSPAESSDPPKLTAREGGTSPDATAREPRPPRTQPTRTRGEDRPPPPSADTSTALAPPATPPPPTTPPPKASGTGTAPASPFQLPDLGL